MKEQIVHKSLRIPCILSSLLFIITACAFFLEVLQLNVLPFKYHLLLIILLLLLFILVVILQRKKKTAIFAIVLAMLFSLATGFGTYYLHISTKALTNITEPAITTEIVGAYTEPNDRATSIEDLLSYKIGILAKLDRKNTDAAIAEIAEEYKTELTLTEYDSIIDLIQALKEHNVDAVLVNRAYLSLLDEVEELKDFSETLRFIWSHEIEEEKPVIQEEEKPQIEASVTNTSFLVYISGNDSKGKLKANGRSDVNMIAVVNPTTHELLLVNTPRDYYVTLADIGEKDKLTHAGVYGIETSIKTLEKLYDVSIPYYVRLNFTGFENIIDALGGVTVHSDLAFSAGQYHFSAGENTLSGKEALAFARERHSFKDGDRQRGKNQQALIQAIIDKVISPQILTNYVQLMEAASNTAETNLSTKEITELVKMQLETGKSWNISSISANGSDAHGSCYSLYNYHAYIMIPDETSVEQVKDAIQKILKGN